MSSIPTGRHLSTLKVPDEALDEYGFQPGDTLKLAYSTIKKGGEYCTAERSKEKKVVFGGMMFWQNNGQCHLPPTQSNGEPCCEVFMWQPNTGGYYYDNCSMRFVSWMHVSDSECSFSKDHMHSSLPPRCFIVPACSSN